MISFSPNSELSCHAQLVGVQSKLVTLFDAGENLEARVDDFLVFRESTIASSLRPSEREAAPNCAVTAAVSSDGVLPITSSKLLCHSLEILAKGTPAAARSSLGEVEDAVNVVVVHVADHHEIDRQRFVAAEASRLFDLIQPRPEMWFVDV